MEESDNSVKNEKPWLFKKGQSGNPAGRPKGSKSLKTYVKEMLEGMTDEEKLAFLEGVDKKVLWEMAEGKPQQDVTSGGEKLIPIPIIPLNNALPTDHSDHQDTESK